MRRVLIGIQARSTSTRLPGKCYETIGGKRLLDHVINAANRAARFSNSFTFKREYDTDVVLLIPEGDPMRQKFWLQASIIEGPLNDVLARYVMACEAYAADFVCRITGDCPLIPPHVITRHISTAVAHDYDYISNVDPECRLAPDGYDCEVISARMLTWLDTEAKSAYDREHVTSLARTAPPPWARRAITAGFVDQSDLKLSVDTPDDLERVRAVYDRTGSVLEIARERYGRDFVHRF